ncbi:EAL domain-containing protein [Sulfurimonas sp.]|uniref:EAL domain-containing protein n=1 Tax=Sulfurimonas sp. TaxID=2022749 RepID=UPI002AB2671B|nr:EAL domain-containing protein [Sulfurimonas sp.]
MSYKVISRKLILVAPLLFFIIACMRIYINHNENKKNIQNFISEQARLIDSLYITHRNYYQNLYINKVIKLDEQTLQGLPAYSAAKISKIFSDNNKLHITMQTVSDRARNPKNQADKYELQAIDFFKNNKNKKEYFAREDDFYQYATPLKIEKKCLKCHGKKENAPLFISKKYDKAYNYKIGDIRGILSIKVPTFYINKIFSKQFFASLVYDFLLISIVSIIAFLLMKFFSKQQEKIEEELNARTSELKVTASRDALTNLENRTMFKENIDKFDNLALILINIDSFSQINDFYGHEFGDAILIEFSKKLKSICVEEENCKLFRLSGDEFAYLVINKPEHIVVQKAKLLSKEINRQTYETKGESIELNTTVCVSLEEKEQLLITADMALKTARKNAKNIIIYDKTMALDREYKNNMLWTKKIKEAIKNDKIILFYQPIINNNDGSIKRYESLIRLIDEEGKVISPYFFLEISKKAKLYKQLTKIVIQKSFEMFRENDFEFSINLSIEDIMDKEINNYILEMLEIYSVSNRVIFEIVESESIENFSEIQKFIKSVKAQGCKIAIDDFGTGYSNFEYLMRLEADFIKIDGSIIKEILVEKNSEIIVSVIVDFAKRAGVKVIAEYVESKEIFDKVKELGVDKSQGYYFSEPKPSLN